MKKWKKRLGMVVLAIFVMAAGVSIYTMLYPPEGVLILEYHKVNDTDQDDPYTVPVQDFCEQLDYLQQQGYETISLLDFMKAAKGKANLPKKAVVLTFDDGYIDNYTELLPVLEEKKAKATVFMVTNYIGTEGYLTWQQLHDMQKRGIEIGSHTANHDPLTPMTPERIEDEIGLSKLLLEWNGIHPVFFFSYPNGIYNDEAIAALKKNQYLAAVTGHSGINTFATNPYLLQRLNIPRPRMGLLEFKVRLFKANLFTRLGILQHSN